jgi:prevent-host-death family protein
MKKVGIRELKNALSEYVRRAEAGETVLVTDRGRTVAVLSPATTRDGGASRYEALVASGVIRPATDKGPLLRGIRTLKLPKGTAQRLIDEGRGER